MKLKVLVEAAVFATSNLCWYLVGCVRVLRRVTVPASAVVAVELCAAVERMSASHCITYFIGRLGVILTHFLFTYL